MLRITGIILTLLSACGGGLAVAFFDIMMTRHARVDSEVGVTVYGLQMIFALYATILATCVSSALWGWGIRRARVAVSRWEVMLHGVLFYPSTVLSVLILGSLGYRLMLAGT